MKSYRTRLACICFIMLCGLSLVPSAHGAKFAADPFTLGVSARGMAMGGATLAGPFDGSAPYWNPAGIVTLDGRYIHAMHAETFGELLNHDVVAYVDANRSRPTRKFVYGMYLYYLGGGGIKITDLNELNRPVVVREESHADILFAFSLALPIRNQLSAGVAAKYINRDIGTESGHGLSLDAGVHWQPKKWAALALVVTDLTTGFIRYSGKTFGEEPNSETIYPAIKPAFTLSAEMQDFVARGAFAGEVRFENLSSAAEYWSGSLSLDTRYGAELSWREMLFARVGSELGRFTTGGGVSFERVTVDFAYLAHDELGDSFRVSAGYRF